MENKHQLLRRLLALLVMLLLCAGLAGSRLVDLQLVHGQEYLERSAQFLTTTSTVSAARGEILDRYGRPMVSNKTGFSLVLMYSDFWENKSDRFDKLLDLAQRVQADAAGLDVTGDMAKVLAAAKTQQSTADSEDTDGTEPENEEAHALLNDMLPISASAPYVYTSEAASGSMMTLSSYIKDSCDTLGLGAVQSAVKQAREAPAEYDADGNEIDKVKRIDATKLISASDFVTAMGKYMTEKLGLPSGLAPDDVRTMVGVYYSMRQVGFSKTITFTLADDVSMDLIAYIKEHHEDYPGVEVQSEAVRQYDTTAAAHVLGTVGVVDASEWKDTYQALPGYQMTSVVGKTGLEKSLESYLHGSSGSRTVETDLGGNAVAEQSTEAPHPGDNVVTTIDLDLQEAAERSLAENLAGNGRGGAAVALDPNTGEVLAMASYPTYSLADYYSTSAAEDRTSDSRHPEMNRATSGVYPPGSTFKVLSAIAGLEEGVIDANTQITCTGVFEYGGQKFTCNNHDTPMTLDVTSALKYSCNTFFYTVGQKLTGAHLEKWSERFGLGVVTGIGIGERSGHAAGPTYRAEMKKADPSTRDWQGGDDVTAAIGQSDNGFTPLQLADYISAVVNGGTLYQPTLVRSIKSYDFSSVIKSETPSAKEKIELSDETRRLVMQGMSEVTDEGGTAGSVFADYPIKVGGKTGTAETYENGEAFDNGLFIAFAPFENPEIVICVVGEGAGHGAYVAPVVRDMLDEFFTADDVENVDAVPTENTLLR